MISIKTDLDEYGMKKTRQRTALLAVLEAADMPLTAAQIHALYLRKDQNAWLSTTYRTLDMFTEKGIVLRTMPLNAETAQYELNRHDHRHYAVCKGCRKMMDIACCPVETANIRTADGEFHVTGHRLEVYGYCGDCYEKQKQNGQ